MTLAELAPVTSRSTGAPACDAVVKPPRATAVVEAETVLLRTRQLSAGLVEVAIGQEVVGFLELAGGVWVALRGPVYSWATEVGQHIDPDLAALALFVGGPCLTVSTGLPHGVGARLYREREQRQRAGRP